MLRATLCCVLLAATAAMAWERLDDVPKALATGEHITYGYGTNKIWGVFPEPAEEDYTTYAASYDLSSGDWTVQDPYGFADYMSQTSITFQWLEGGVLFVIGNEDEEDPVMYTYNVSDDEWDYDDLPFSLYSGASIAYQPNGNYNIQVNPVPGWIYCLPGGGTEFWRYSIPSSLPPEPLYGVYPGQNAIIAQTKPLFEWGSSTTTQYRLLVCADTGFRDTVIDITETQPQHQVTSALANGAYHWRIATWTGATWAWSSAHDFVLDGGWQQLQNVPDDHAVGSGAGLAFIDDGQGHDSIIAFLGGGNHYFYEYSIGNPGWTSKDPTDKPQYAGTSLATPVPTGNFPWAVFWSEGTSDYPYYFDVWHTPPSWFPDDNYLSNRFPEYIGSNSSATLAPGYMYLAVGDNHFYRLDPPMLEGGMSAGVTRPANPRTHVVTRYDAVEVEYELAASGRVRATLHDAVGRQVGVLDAGEQKPGVHRLIWNQDREGRRLSAGAYFVTLDMGNEQARLKAVIR
jgi:hypothetical protein